MLDTVAALFAGAPTLLILCAIGLALEYLRPCERDQPASASIFNFIWIVNFIVMTNLALYFLGKYVQIGIAFLHGPLVTIPFPDTWYGNAAQLVLFMFLHDLCYYTMHRCQHTFAWFWAHHKFHHTDDFRRDHAAFSAGGARFVEAPREETYGTVAVFEDLYGNRWDLIQPRA